jgi:hypothetical protein
MKYFFLILIFFSISVYSQDNLEDIDEEIVDEIDIHKYILNPDLKDSICISDIKIAKEDVSNGKIVFTHPVGMSFGYLRYEKELRILCAKYKLYFETSLLGDIIEDGQTQGCYGYYMDNIIKEKYGSDFKSKLYKTADSLYLVSIIKYNKVISYNDCDTGPMVPDQHEYFGTFSPIIKISKPNIKKEKRKYGGWPFLCIKFIIEKDSTVSNIQLNQFVAEHKENIKYKKELYDIALKYFKEKYPIWIPGKIAGIPVRTKNEIRFYFEKE